jgi:hypothetical protein
MGASTSEGTGPGSAANIKNLILNGNVLPLNLSPQVIEEIKSYSHVGPQGLQGYSSGQVLYLNNSVSDLIIDGYKELGNFPSGNSQSFLTQVLSETPTLFGSFITPSGYPNTTILPPGIIDANVWIAITGGNGFINGGYFYFEFYKRNLAGLETLLFTTDPSENYINFEPFAINSSVAVPLAISNLSVTDRIVVKLYGVQSVGANTQMTFYFEGTSHFSHIHTTLSVNGANGLSVFSLSGPYSAAGTSTADATVISPVTVPTVITISSDSDSKGVRLPEVSAGLSIILNNTDSNNKCYVYPPTDGYLDGNSKNTGKQIDSKKAATYICVDATSGANKFIWFKSE